MPPRSNGFYVGAVIGGIGVGCVYATCVNSALKWFPDKRGLAGGPHGGGLRLRHRADHHPIANMLKTSGYSQTFFFFGLLQGAIILLAAGFLRAPGNREVVYSSSVAQSRRDYTLGEALRTPVFYVMLAMFICTVSGGLMAVAQLGVIAEDLGVKHVEVNLYFFAMAALPFALMMDRILNGFSVRSSAGSPTISAREKTMFFAFTMEGIGIIALGTFGHNRGRSSSSAVLCSWPGRSLFSVQCNCRRYFR